MIYIRDGKAYSVSDPTPPTTEDHAAIETINQKRYWLSAPEDELIDKEIRKRYSISAEFAIQRQRDEKPDEYAEYYSYCEQCKKLVREKIAFYRDGGNQ